MKNWVKGAAFWIIAAGMFVFVGSVRRLFAALHHFGDVNILLLKIPTQSE